MRPRLSPCRRSGASIEKPKQRLFSDLEPKLSAIILALGARKSEVPSSGKFEIVQPARLPLAVKRRRNKAERS